MKGTYLLIMHLGQPLPRLAVGRLGCFDFAPGSYLYIGSAYGPGGIPARLAHHQRHHKPRPHWHLDYLCPHLTIVETWTITGLSERTLETTWSNALAQHLRIPVRGFGSSDTHSIAHLFYSPHPPQQSILTSTLFESVPSRIGNTEKVHLQVSPVHPTP